MVVDERETVDASNAVVVYDNPYDTIADMAKIFFGRCLVAGRDLHSPTFSST